MPYDPAGVICFVTFKGTKQLSRLARDPRRRNHVVAHDQLMPVVSRLAHRRWSTDEFRAGGHAAAARKDRHGG